MPEQILVADDEPANRDLLEAVLTDAGYTVTVAENGATALVAIHRDPPALLLLDLVMPGMSGLEVCRALKRDPATAGIPVLVVTAYGEPLERERILTWGADDVVPKPIEAAELLPRVRALLAVRHIRHQLDRTLAYLEALEAERGRPQLTPPEPSAAESRREPVSGGGLLLLADDEPLIRQLFAEMLQEQGFQVWAAADGTGALRLLERTPVETVVLDLAMPAMSGLEVLARIRKLDPALPVLVLTAQATSKSAIAALKLGAFDFILKGSSPPEVALAVHRAVRHRRDLLAQGREVAALRTQLAGLRGTVAPPHAR